MKHSNTIPRPKVNLEDAQQLLSMLAGYGPVTFQTFDDNKSRDPRPAKIFHGTLQQHSNALQRLNDEGRGVFVTVNETDLKGRTAKNIVRVRALFLDLDGAPIEPVITQARNAQVMPHLTVKSSGNGDHVYWLVADCTLDQFGQLQAALACRFGGDDKIVDLPRVMRLPGFIWQKVDKYGEPVSSPCVSCITSSLNVEDHPAYTVDQLVNGLGLVLDQDGPVAGAMDIARLLSDSPLRDVAKGQWPAILEAAHVEQGFLDGKHRPCPGCGGIDRFRFDNLDGHGTFICSGGGAHTTAGDGFSLLRHVTGWSREQVDVHVDTVLNGDPLARINDALQAAQEDSGAMFEEPVLRALHSLKQRSQADYQRARSKAKKIPGISITALEKAITEVFERDGDEAASQLGYAKDTIASFGSGNLINAQGSFWKWSTKGVWQETDPHLVKQAIHRVMPNSDITGGSVDSVLKLVGTECFKPAIDLGGAFEGINCPNGELHFEAGVWKLRPHVKEHYLISQIPVPYDPDAEATRFNRFLDEIFYGDPDKLDKKWLVMELIGYTLLSTCRYEKFAILIGSGANGKSVLLEVIKALCGIDNVAAVQPEQMAKAFQRAYLLGKLANLVTEIAEGAVINDAALKAVTSGEYMTAERKYRDPFSFAPFATCWFGTNHMPHTRDFSDALFRRACILTFNNKFEGANCDPHLKAALLTELPGILNMALHAIGCVFQLEEFTMPASSVDARAEWRIEADQVRQFVEECCQLGGGQENNEDLYEAYELWTKEAGISRPLKKISFLKRLTRLGPEPGRSSSARYYSGITLINRPSPPYFYARK